MIKNVNLLVIYEVHFNAIRKMWTFSNKQQRDLEASSGISTHMKKDICLSPQEQVSVHIQLKYVSGH